jgi:AAA domain/Bifunctional DNA primase/polymerase, N-terminal
MNSLAGGIEAAKAYARRGWRVVILHASADDACTCRKGGGCPKPAKHPRLTRWHEKATVDENELERLFSKWPESNLGVRLGPTSGIVDIEYDDEEGKATAKRLLNGIATPTYTSHRSTHRLFRFPDGLAIPKAVVTVQGLEMRFGIDKRGSQSVFPPSVHASGVRYEWLAGLSPDDVELATFPATLAELLTTTQTNDSDSLDFVMGDGESDLRTHRGASEGERNATLCRLVGGYIKMNGPDADLPTLALAWAARCSPTFPDEDVLRIVANLASKEQSKGVQTTSQSKPVAALSLGSRLYRDIEPQAVEWLWPNRIALGKLSLIVGQPGFGKTFLAVDMAARVSTGSAFPDGSMPASGEAAILTCEDGASDTLRPRLDAAGADVSRVHHIDGIRSCDGKPHFVSLASHLPIVEQWLLAHPEVRLLVIDPISAFMGDGDSHKNADVRAVLGPLAELAERHRLAVLGITHLSKGQAKAINRIIGSIAFVAAARAAWLIGEDPDMPERRLFLPVKNNLGKAGGLAYRLAGEDQATCIEWDTEPVLISADDIDDDGERTPLEEAREWLEAQLAESPVPSASVLKRAKADGIAERTLRRAKDELGIVSEREGKAWVWRLPEMTPLDTDNDAFIVE